MQEMLLGDKNSNYTHIDNFEHMKHKLGKNGE